ncbi:MAG: Ldh family oxidoreductase, partial [Bacteroidota bacterium]|nr:Ldh family oxidoreductase [Bacteroidota bacterium]
DMAMSQYSYGKLNQYKMHQEELPFQGGFNDKGKLTTDPAQILESKRLLPAGMWKGSGLSIMLDLFCTLLSGGRSVEDIGALNDEYGVSQVFICFYMKDKPADYVDSIAKKLVNFIHQENKDEHHVFYPGERTLMKRKENSINGIPVDEKIWNMVRSYQF